MLSITVSILFLIANDRVTHRLHAVGVGAQHEHAVAPDAVLVQSLYGPLDVLDGLRLLEPVQRLLIDRLQTEVHELAA
jgi:hypothetical protein